MAAHPVPGRCLDQLRLDDCAFIEPLRAARDEFARRRKIEHARHVAWNRAQPLLLFAINRGGQATYHGPGQLIGYPIIDLRRCGQDLHKYLRWLEQLLIDFLARYEIAASRRESLTGVWVEERKIASIGVGVRHWITMHGFALNVSGDLSPFDHIVPCGINNVAMTSMEKETGKVFPVTDVARAAEKLALHRIKSLRVAPETQLIDA